MIPPPFNASLLPCPAAAQALLATHGATLAPFSVHVPPMVTIPPVLGLIAYTSSSASFVPNPLSSLYASTKSFMTLFATSVAGEVHSMGIDVVVVHPSPMDTNFFNEAGSMGEWAIAKHDWPSTSFPPPSSPFLLQQPR